MHILILIGFVFLTGVQLHAQEVCATVPILQQVELISPNPDKLHGDVCTIRRGGQLCTLGAEGSVTVAYYKARADVQGDECPSGGSVFVLTRDFQAMQAAFDEATTARIRLHEAIRDTTKGGGRQR